MLKITFDKLLISKDLIKQLNRFSLVKRTPRICSDERFKQTVEEFNVKYQLAECGIIRISPHIPLRLVGSTAGELAMWNLEEPEDRHYVFYCDTTITIHQDEIMDRLRKLPYIIKIEKYANLFTRT